MYSPPSIQCASTSNCSLSSVTCSKYSPSFLSALNRMTFTFSSFPQPSALFPYFAIPPTSLSHTLFFPIVFALLSQHFSLPTNYHPLIAVVWKITPLLATWLTSPSSPLTKHGLLTPSTTILELGCGISGIMGLSISPFAKSYILTDQPYVQKLLSVNLSSNTRSTSTTSSLPSKRAPRQNRNANKNPHLNSTPKQPSQDTLKFVPLDWETDSITNLFSSNPSSTNNQNEPPGFDIVLALDCIYNDTLIPPLVSTLFDACSLRPSLPSSLSSSPHQSFPSPNQSSSNEPPPTLCIIAQQLRSPEVFGAWLRRFMERFRVWRVPDEVLSEGLREGSGFVVHFGVLR